MKCTGAGSPQLASAKRLQNPSSIKYEDLLFLPSTFSIAEGNLPAVSVLFLPPPTPLRGTPQSAADLDALIKPYLKQFEQQSHQPISYHVLPTTESLRLGQALPDDVYAFLPTPDESEFTFVVPLLSDSSTGVKAQLLRFGRETVAGLVRLSGTKEFGGALLELGCQQAAFVHTSWLDKLAFGLASNGSSSNEDNEEGEDEGAIVPGRMTWRRRRGFGVLTIPLMDEHQAASTGVSPAFWASGLLTCPIDPDKLDVLGRVGFLLELEPEEDAVEWEEGWQAIVCEFTSRRRNEVWAPEVFLLDPTGRARGQKLLCEDGREVRKRLVGAKGWQQEVVEADVLFHGTGGIVDHDLKRRDIEGERNRRWVAIGLPREDLQHSAWTAALDPEALSSTLLSLCYALVC